MRCVEIRLPLHRETTIYELALPDMPKYRFHVDLIESTQNQFLLFAQRKLDWIPNVYFSPHEHRLLLII